MYPALIKLSKKTSNWLKKKRAKDLNRCFIKEEKSGRGVCEKTFSIVNHLGNEVKALDKD